MTTLRLPSDQSLFVTNSTFPQNNNQSKPTQNLEKALLRFSIFDKGRRENGQLAFSKAVQHIHKKTYEPGQILFDKADSSVQNTFFLIEKGTVHLFAVSVDEPQELQTLIMVQQLSTKQYFGERQHLRNGLLLVKAVAVEEVSVYTLPLSYVYILCKGTMYFPQLTKLLEFVSKVSLFGSLEPTKLYQMVVFAQVLDDIPKNKKIFDEGAPVTHGYVVLGGDFQILRRVEPDPVANGQAFNLNSQVLISCVGEYQTLGMEEILLESPRYTDTAYCVSLKGKLLKFSKDQLLKNFNGSHNMRNRVELCKSKQNWKSNRIGKSAYVKPSREVASRERAQTSNSINPRMRCVTEPYSRQRDSSMRRDSEDSLFPLPNKLSSITNKKLGQYFRSEEQYFQYKLDTLQRRRSSTNSLGRTGAFELRPSTGSYSVYPAQDPRKDDNMETSNSQINMSGIFLKKFVTKKIRLHNKMVIDYLKKAPPELIFNPQKEYSIFKPLYVAESAAVKNRKKSIYHLKSKYKIPPKGFNISGGTVAAVMPVQKKKIS